MNTQLQPIVSHIVGHWQPAFIYLLARQSRQLNTNTIFTSQPHSSAENDQFHLLITLDDYKQLRGETIQENIESAFLPGQLTAWVIPALQFLEGIIAGHYFEHTVAAKGQLLYEKPGIILPAPQSGQRIIPPDPQPWLNRSQEFFAAAQLLLLRKQPSLAAFQLHQAAEQAYTAIIICHSGFRPPSHNLVRLHRYARFFAPQINQLFPSASLKEECLLQQLQKAYIQSRYNNHFYYKAASLLTLSESIRELQHIAAGTKVTPAETLQFLSTTGTTE